MATSTLAPASTAPTNLSERDAGPTQMTITPSSPGHPIRIPFEIQMVNPEASFNRFEFSLWRNPLWRDMFALFESIELVDITCELTLAPSLNLEVTLELSPGPFADYDPDDPGPLRTAPYTWRFHSGQYGYGSHQWRLPKPNAMGTQLKGPTLGNEAPSIAISMGFLNEDTGRLIARFELFALGRGTGIVPGFYITQSGNPAFFRSSTGSSRTSVREHAHKLLTEASSSS